MAMESLLSLLKALADPTRLRLLVLCDRSDLTVSDLTNILGQSQPRVSRHLKVMVEGQVLERRSEGQRVFYGRKRGQELDPVLDAVVAVHLEQAQDLQSTSADLERLQGTLEARSQLAKGYFDRHAAKWHQVRSHYNDHTLAEALFIDELKSGDQAHCQEYLDLGTGTGRILEIASPHFDGGIGVDNNREMLAIARAKLDENQIRHAHVQEADISALPFGRNRFDCIGLYQVLHFIEEPATVIREAGRVLQPGGRLLILDYGEHGHKELQRDFAHLWLGFSDDEISSWLEMAQLELVAKRELDKSEKGQGPDVRLWVAYKEQ